MDYINKIRTVDGDKPVNYEALANKPGAFTGASDTETGAAGFVPAPAAGDNSKFLSGDGTWKEVSVEAFSVTISTQMPAGVEVCDKTYAEIKAAILAGKTVTAAREGGYGLSVHQWPASDSSTTPFLFVGFRAAVGTSSITFYRDMYILSSDDTVTHKVTTWTA